MKGRKRAFARSALIWACLALAAASPALAQGRGGGGPPGGGPGGPGGGMGGPPQFPNGGPGPMGGAPQRGQPAEPPRPSLELAPPGRWWDDKSMAKSLRLRPDQQSRMDAIFDQNRNVLLSRLEGVQQAEAQMVQISRSPVPDEAALFTQIDRVAQARAELEKATTHMLLQMRKEMDADQLKRFDRSMQR